MENLETTLSPHQIKQRINMLQEYALTYIPPVVKAIVLLLLGLWIINKINALITKAFQKTHLDPTVARFLVNFISVVMKIMLLISIASVFGIQTTSFIALIGAAGLAIGMSLQGSLSNFAGGILILFFKPYKVGDTVEIQGQKGRVHEIGVFTTTLITLQNNTAIIPNGPIINGNIINYSTKKSIRVDVHVGVGYGEDIDTVKKVLLQTVQSNAFCLQDPKPAVYVKELADSAVTMLVRGYALPQHYRDMYFSLTEEVKKSLDKANIEIPFPQRVVYQKTQQ